MKLIIGIPTINRKDLLLESLQDLANGFGEDLHKLIILDNGNQDILSGTQDNTFPEIFKDKLHLEVEPENRGCGGSWNKILDLAYFRYDADHVLILNDDIVLGKTFKDIKKMLNKNKGYHFIVTSFFWSAFMISKKAFLDIGYFDPIFHPAYYEDNDYHLRLKKFYGNKLKESTEEILTPTIARNSMTIKKDSSLSQGHKSGVKYRQKWGANPREEGYEFPYNDETNGYKLDGDVYDTGIKETPLRVVRPTYLVWSPPWSSCTGGIIALHYLCHNLNEYGEKAYMVNCAGKVNPHYNTPIFEGDYLDPKNIIIYPEIVGDNPCNVKNVVRWLLYYVDPNRYTEENDMIVAYSENFKKGMPDDTHVMTILESKADFFHDQGNKREGDCYIEKKNSGAGHIHSPTAYRLSGQENDSDFLRIFNQYERFYSYDNETYLNTIAALCGCESVIVPGPDKKREDIMEKQPVFKYGVAFGVEDLEWANSTRDKVRENLAEIGQVSRQQILDFIEITKEKFIKGLI